jgi:predicted nucleotidyltransferase
MIREDKLPSDILEKLNALPGKINNDKDIIALIVFGSAATGKLKPLSDIDLAVLLDDW